MGSIPHVAPFVRFRKRLNLNISSGSLPVTVPRRGPRSEAVPVFDPGRLLEVLEALTAKTQPVHHVGAGRLDQTLIDVDGSVVKTLQTIAKAAFLTDHNSDSQSARRLHTLFDMENPLPLTIEVTPGCNRGHDDENNRVCNRLTPDHGYAMDRWYAQFTHWNEIVGFGTSYACRIRDNSNLDYVAEERPE